ncbi:MAG: peptidylprolyl isomerase [Phycisphaerae bacterium]|nr:peptidylprolyl isomerase [Phycisphaerae bacterium]
MRIFISSLLVLVVFASTEIFAAEADKPSEIVIDVNSATPAVDPNAVAITVNGIKVTEGQIEELLAPRMKQMAGRVPVEMMDKYKQQMRKQALEQMIVETVLIQKEKEKNITASPEELQTQIDKQIAQQNLNLDDFKALLKAYGVEYSQFEDNMRKRIMFEKLMEMQFSDKIIPPTEEQIKAYYNENLPQFAQPEKIHAKHILITPADGNDPNAAKLEAKAKAQDILDKIKKGDDFEQLAKDNSACPSGKEGGDLGVQPKGTFVPEFEKAAYALEPGQISDVVETQFGCHIIKLIEHIDANTTGLEQAKPQITETLKDQQKEKVVMAYVQEIKAGADVKFANEADKFELSPPKPAAPAQAPVRKPEQKLAAPEQPAPAVKAEKIDKAEVKTEAKTEVSIEKSDKKLDEKARKKAEKEARKKAKEAAKKAKEAEKEAEKVAKRKAKEKK